MDLAKRSVDLEFFESPEAKRQDGMHDVNGSVSPVWRVSHDTSREESPERPRLSVTRGKPLPEPSPKSPEMSPAKKR